MKTDFLQANPANYKRGRTSKIDYIVVHYTSNRGDTAKNNATYFAREAVEAGAHYFADESGVWQSVKDTDTAYHCGAASYRHPKCRNANSLGVEICMNDKNGSVRMGSIETAAELVRYLMARYGIPIDRVVRHYDVTGKYCPGPMVADRGLWEQFLALCENNNTEVESMRYKYYEDMPEWAQPTVKKLMDKGFLKGEGDGTLNLSEDTLKTLVITDRAGLYGA